MRAWLLAGCLALALSAKAALPELRVVVDTSTAMPMTLVEHGELTGGIHRDLGLALARQLGTTARFTPMPRKRVGVVLEQGEGDLSCHYLPAWLPGAVDWTLPFMPNAIEIVSHLQHPAPARIDQLRGVPLGTVLGFAYPELQQALGEGFVRDEASDSLQNLVKFAAGRTRHVVVGDVFFRYQQRLHPGLLQTHRPLLVARIEARCAVSRRGRYSVARIDQAIRALQKNGRVEAIYAAYR